MKLEPMQLAASRPPSRQIEADIADIQAENAALSARLEAAENERDGLKLLVARLRAEADAAKAETTEVVVSLRMIEAMARAAQEGR